MATVLIESEFVKVFVGQGIREGKEGVEVMMSTSSTNTINTGIFPENWRTHIEHSEFVRDADKFFIKGVLDEFYPTHVKAFECDWFGRFWDFADDLFVAHDSAWGVEELDKTVKLSVYRFRPVCTQRTF